MKTVPKIVIALLTLSLATAGVLVAVKGTGTAPQYRGLLLKCFDQQALPDFDERVKCAELVYSAASQRSEMPKLIEVLAQIADQNREPENFQVCHYAAHEFGPSVVEKLGGVLPAIDVLSTPVCGFVHGPYDIFGRESHTFSEWVQMVRLCEKTKEKSSNIQCSDALGHALAQSVMSRGTNYDEWVFSTKVCAEFLGVGGRLDCGEALLMERYGPLDPTLVAEVAPPLGTLASSCLELPIDVLSAREGCASGVGWYLSEHFSIELGVAYSKRDTPSHDEINKRVITEMREVCAKTGDDLSGYCLRRFVSLLNVYTLQDPDLLSRFCNSLWMAGGERDCLFAARNRLDQVTREKVAALNTEFVPDLATAPEIYPSDVPPALTRR